MARVHRLIFAYLPKYFFGISHVSDETMSVNGKLVCNSIAGEWRTLEEVRYGFRDDVITQEIVTGRNLTCHTVYGNSLSFPSKTGERKHFVCIHLIPRTFSRQNTLCFLLRVEKPEIIVLPLTNPIIRGIRYTVTYAAHFNDPRNGHGCNIPVRFLWEEPDEYWLGDHENVVPARLTLELSGNAEPKQGVPLATQVNENILGVLAMIKALS